MTMTDIFCTWSKLRRRANPLKKYQLSALTADPSILKEADKKVHLLMRFWGGPVKVLT